MLCNPTHSILGRQDRQKMRIMTAANTAPPPMGVSYLERSTKSCVGVTETAVTRV